ncbi:unnamed protein product [Brachionus calyciflorus]|uniref:Cyclin-like domain-containing protein n=1 Tax=Brachionus calyciflorus TaxID=104777 RepID=A0A813ZF47_9BILA|nr:unnamed protein product [Brachionus calyciflorus]
MAAAQSASNQTTSSQINPTNVDHLNGSTSNLTSSSMSSINSTTNTTTQIPTNPTTPNTNIPSIETRWIFTKEKIDNSPSRMEGLSAEQELKERQEAALFISDLGIELKVNQLCINTAIIYMHRFFMIHSFKKFHRYMVATSCLFLACKVEEQPRRLSDFITAIHHLFRKANETMTYIREEYKRYEEEIVTLESCLLQTLGFNVLINHAHTFIIKTCQMIKAPRDLAEAAYLTATNSLILTNFCVKFSSEKIACFCIFLACKGHDLIIPTSSEGLQWYQYVKHDIVEQELEDISKEYLAIYEKCMPMVQKKIGKPRVADQQQPNPQAAHRHQHPTQAKKPYPPQPNPHHDMHPPHAAQSQTGQQNVNIPHHQHKQPHPSVHKNPQIPNGSHPSSHQYHQKHPGHPHPQAQQTNRPPQQQQQQHPHQQNLNKSLPITPSQTPSNHKPQQAQTPQQPIKHPSSSNINPNKNNGSLNIKSEPVDKNIFNPSKKPSIPPPPVQLSTQIKTSPSSSQNSSSSGTTASMKRTNEELNNNITSAPNKIPKYVVDQKSAS